MAGYDLWDRAVLFVAADGWFRRTSCRALVSNGCTVFVADRPTEALEVFADRWVSIDLLILDLNGADESGRQLAESLTSLHPKLPVLFTVGDHEEANRILRRDGGPWSSLAKPFVAEDLLAGASAALHGTAGS